jgi:hypothetical protein
VKPRCIIFRSYNLPLNYPKNRMRLSGLQKIIIGFKWPYPHFATLAFWAFAKTFRAPYIKNYLPEEKCHHISSYMIFRYGVKEHVKRKLRSIACIVRKLWRFNVLWHFVYRKCNRKSVLKKRKFPTRARSHCGKMLKFHSDELRGEGYRSMKGNNNTDTLQEQ